MTTFNALQKVNLRTDAAFVPANEKKNKIVASFLALPTNVAAIGVLAVILFFFSLAGTTKAASPSPGWTVDSVATPTNFFPSTHNAACEATASLNDGTDGSVTIQCDSYEVVATNAGAAATDGGPITLSDT